jgi:hypothetical protein
MKAMDKPSAKINMAIHHLGILEFFLRTTSMEKTNFEGWESWDIVCERRANCSLGAKDATHWFICVVFEQLRFKVEEIV